MVEGGGVSSVVFLPVILLYTGYSYDNGYLGKLGSMGFRMEWQCVLLYSVTATVRCCFSALAPHKSGPGTGASGYDSGGSHVAVSGGVSGVSY